MASQAKLQRAARRVSYLLMAERRSSGALPSTDSSPGEEWAERSTPKAARGRRTRRPNAQSFDFGVLATCRVSGCERERVVWKDMCSLHEAKAAVRRVSATLAFQRARHPASRTRSQSEAVRPRPRLSSPSPAPALPPVGEAGPETAPAPAPEPEPEPEQFEEYDEHDFDEPGLLVWRVENMRLVPVAEAAHGRFCTHDAYLVCHVREPGRDEQAGRLIRHLHFWIGEHAERDKQAVASIKTVEVSHRVDMAACHREPQGAESDRFRAYFMTAEGDDQLAYDDTGGTQSGLRRMQDRDEEARVRLYGVVSETSQVTELPLEPASLRSSPVIVVDDGRAIIWLWCAARATAREKAGGLETAFRMRRERSTARQRRQVRPVEEGEELHAFTDLLRGAGVLAGGADLAAASVPAVPEEGDGVRASLLYAITYDPESGHPRFDEVNDVDTPPSMQALAADGVFVVDCETELYVWEGRDADAGKRRAGSKAAHVLLSVVERPAWVQITRVPQGQEPFLFRSKFHDWGAHEASPVAAPAPTTAKHRRAPTAAAIVSAVQTMASYEISVGAEAAASDLLLAPDSPSRPPPLLATRAASIDVSVAEAGAAEDDGEGQLLVWLVEGERLTSLADADLGHFSTSASYVCLYAFTAAEEDTRFVAYFWAGRRAAPADYVRWRLSLRADAVQSWHEATGCGLELPEVRVAQDYEPDHFLRIFADGVITHDEQLLDAARPAALFHVKGQGSDALDTRATQVRAEAASLNSSDVFVLLAADEASGEPEVFFWVGEGSSTAEQEAGAGIAMELMGYFEVPEEVTIRVVEEEEGADCEHLERFWAHMGGCAPYADDAYLRAWADDAPDEFPRLFRCVCDAGAIETTEVLKFHQGSLRPEGVFLLDAWGAVFAWAGAEAAHAQRRRLRQTACAYVAALSHVRPASLQRGLEWVEAGAEPLAFRAAFRGWDASGAAFADPFDSASASASASGELGHVLDTQQADAPSQLQSALRTEIVSHHPALTKTFSTAGSPAEGVVSSADVGVLPLPLPGSGGSGGSGSGGSGSGGSASGGSAEEAPVVEETGDEQKEQKEQEEESWLDSLLSSTRARATSRAQARNEEQPDIFDWVSSFFSGDGEGEESPPAQAAQAAQAADPLLADVSVTVPKADVHAASSTVHYSLRVQRGDRHWVARRRYRELYDMVCALEDAGLPVPEGFPPRLWLCTPTTAAFVDRRRRAIGAFMADLVAEPRLCAHPAVQRVLAPTAARKKRGGGKK